jgi:hypothetical protein
MAISGNYLFLNNPDTIAAYDISDPANPVFITDYMFMGGANITYSLIDGDFLYFNAWYLDRIYRVNITDPRNIGNYANYRHFQGESNFALGFLVEDGVAYAAGFTNRITVVNMMSLAAIRAVEIPGGVYALYKQGDRFFTGGNWDMPITITITATPQ